MRSTTEAEAAYEVALARFRAASQALYAASAKYRAREIGDVEYLAARRACDAADAELDAAGVAAFGEGV